jgi:predicted Fe-Mo cluster-binding NifX family protein
MKVVLTVWEDRISPVADSAGELLVVDVENRTVRGRRSESIETESLFSRARRLSGLEAEIFICGAISDFFAGLLKGYGIQLMPFICGKVEEVLDAYLEGSLLSPKFMMTGC